MAHEEAERNGRIFVGRSPRVTQISLYADLKALQAKTVSFIAYVLRSFLDVVKPYEHQIALGVISLLKDCPTEASGTRKEILIAARHLWHPEFQAVFIPYLPILLNEDVLLGTGLTCRETLRYLIFLNEGL